MAYGLKASSCDPLTVQGTQLPHWYFMTSSGYCFMAHNMENIDFGTFFTVTSQQWSALK